LREKNNLLIAARKESPLVIGLGKGRIFCRLGHAPPVLPYTREFIFMEDGEVALLSSQGVKFFDAQGGEVTKEPKQVNWNPLMAEKGGTNISWLKEIFEQPRAVIDTIRAGYQKRRAIAVLEDVHFDTTFLKKDATMINLIACGTLIMRRLVGKFLIEEFCRIPVRGDIGSEFPISESHY